MIFFGYNSTISHHCDDSSFSTQRGRRSLTSQVSQVSMQYVGWWFWYQTSARKITLQLKKVLKGPQIIIKKLKMFRCTYFNNKSNSFVLQRESLHFFCYKQVSSFMFNLSSFLLFQIFICLLRKTLACFYDCFNIFTYIGHIAEISARDRQENPSTRHIRKEKSWSA